MLSPYYVGKQNCRYRDANGILLEGDALKGVHDGDNLGYVRRDLSLAAAPNSRPDGPAGAIDSILKPKPFTHFEGYRQIIYGVGVYCVA